MFEPKIHVLLYQNSAPLVSRPCAVNNLHTYAATLRSTFWKVDRKVCERPEKFDECCINDCSTECNRIYFFSSPKKCILRDHISRLPLRLLKSLFITCFGKGHKNHFFCAKRGKFWGSLFYEYILTGYTFKANYNFVCFFVFGHQ